MLKLPLFTLLLIAAFSTAADDYQNPLDTAPQGDEARQCVYEPFADVISHSGDGYELNYRVRCNHFVGQLVNKTDSVLSCEFKGQTTGYSGSITALPKQTTETAQIAMIAALGSDYTLGCAPRQTKIKTLQSRPDGCCELQQRTSQGEYQLRVKSLKPMIFGGSDSLCTIKTPSAGKTLVSERVAPDAATSWVGTDSAAKLTWGCSR